MKNLLILIEKKKRKLKNPLKKSKKGQDDLIKNFLMQ